ncbi:MAG TPA: hypothetical protein VFE47_20965 [Tepidisphaeraceae bacterium]|nr:hypothetical protein [Tepidisphaeraceae bacterium]
MDVIFDNIDDLLLAGKFKECDALLMSVPTEQFTNAQLITALTATAAARAMLHDRGKFFARVDRTLRDRGANVAALLSGLA